MKKPVSRVFGFFYATILAFHGVVLPNALAQQKPLKSGLNTRSRAGSVDGDDA